MTRALKYCAAGAICAAAFGVTAASAAGTASGTDIKNDVSVSFQVGGENQTAATGSDTFKVDRKVDFTVSEATPLGTTSVGPNQKLAVVSYTVTNNSNAELDFALLAENLANGSTAEHGGTDNFDVAIQRICLDADKNGACDAGFTNISKIENLIADGSVNILVLSDIPIGAPNNGVAGVTLTATAQNADGTVIVASTDTDANTAGEETVFADTNRDGIESAGDDYTVQAAQLTVTKLSRVVSDGLGAAGDTTNPKAIPGATVEYCIVVANGTGAATATSVNVTDDLSITTLDGVTYDTTFGVLTNGTAVSGNICTPGTDTGNYDVANDVVSGTLANIPGGEQRTLVFRVTIDSN